SMEHVKAIVDLMMKRVTEQLKAKDIEIVLTDQAKDLIAAKGYDPALGARPLRRTIQRMIEDPLSEKLLWKEFTAPSQLRRPASARKSSNGGAVTVAAGGPSPTTHSVVPARRRRAGRPVACRRISSQITADSRQRIVALKSRAFTIESVAQML